MQPITVIKPIQTNWIYLLLLFTIISCTQQQSLQSDAIQQIKIKNLQHPKSSIFASGQPTKAQLEQLAQSGISHIINLRPKPEQNWDEQGLVTSLGMTYHALPIAGAQDINIENAMTLTELLQQLKGESVLVHCASGNRVGALIALAAAKSRQLNTNDAIAEGKRWGLSKLEPIVRKQLLSSDATNQ